MGSALCLAGGRPCAQFWKCRWMTSGCTGRAIDKRNNLWTLFKTHMLQQLHYCSPSGKVSDGSAVRLHQVLSKARLAAMLAPIVYECIVTWTGGFLPFFMTMATMCVSNLYLVLSLASAGHRFVFFPERSWSGAEVSQCSRLAFLNVAIPNESWAFSDPLQS